MRINDVKDERIMMESNNIISAVSGILVLGIVGDIFFKIYSNKPIQSYLFEVIVLIIAGIFYLIEATRKGVLELINNQKEKRRLKIKYVLTNTVLALSFAGADLFSGQAKSNTDKLYLGIGVVAFIILGFFIDVFVMKKANKNIDDKINK